jgi:serine protease Do
MQKHFISGLVGALLGALVVIIYLHIFLKPPVSSTSDMTPAPVQKGMASEPNNIVNAVEMIQPSVVFIATTAFMKVQRPVGVPFGFFTMPGYESQIVPRQGAGSGVIVDSKGLILTNEHVVHGATEIVVTLSNDRHIAGKVKGADQLSDIALVQVDAQDLQAAKLGNSDKLRIGESVIAVGNPYQFQHTVTVGVLSGRGRSLSEQSKDFQDLLQTDAAINPGNSGGPLVNTQGEVIGINTAIFRDAQGIGFAIPINTARNVMEQLLARGKVRRPYVGIYMQDINEQLAQGLNLPVKEGIIVVDVAPGSPAAQAHLQQKDIILAVDNKELKKSDELRKILHEKSPGEEITLKIWREGKAGTLSLTLGEGP